MHEVALGYSAVVPDDDPVGRSWLPEVEAVALGIVVAGGNIDDASTRTWRLDYKATIA